MIQHQAHAPIELFAARNMYLYRRVGYIAPAQIAL